MKKVTFIALSLIFLSGISSAFTLKSNEGDAMTVSLTGKVVDQTNQEALAGALIRIEGTDFEAYTDFDGNFTIKGIVPDSYKLQCSMISYTDLEEEIKIDQTSGEMVLSLQNVAINQASQKSEK